MSEGASNPFSPRAVLAMLMVGAVAFLATLYFIGIGEVGNDGNDGGGHVGGRGLNGYAALARILENSDREIIRSRNEGALDSDGLLILTPPHHTDTEKLNEIVQSRRFSGPTIVVLPKWEAVPAPDFQKDAEDGWVILSRAKAPRWEGFADDLSVVIAPASGWTARNMAGQTYSGKLPVPAKVQFGISTNNSDENRVLLPLVHSKDGKHILAGYMADGGSYPWLERIAGRQAGASNGNEGLQPLIYVFEPDLLNNYGFARRENAVLANQLIQAASKGQPVPIIFDMTLNGLGRSSNLLTLAFTPPFLAATLCLIIAGIIVAWRALHRFGPAFAEGQTMAFGKRQLVANSAGLIRRTRRLHLLGPPYAAMLRGRIAQLLGLRAHGDDQQTEMDINRLIAARAPDTPTFSSLADRLRNPRGPADLLHAAKGLKQIERMLEK